MADDKLTCTVLFFAAAADAAGKRQMEITLDRGATVRDVIELCANEALESLCKVCAFAIDESIVQEEAEVTDGCTIAVLPPVSGG